MSTSTGKGPAVAYFRARDAVEARWREARGVQGARDAHARGGAPGAIRSEGEPPAAAEVPPAIDRARHV
jgi:hypothetical protein